MNYTTYWSILDTPAKSMQTNSIFLCIAIGAMLLWLLAKKFKKDKGDGERTIILWATGVFTVLGFTGYAMLTFLYPDKTAEKTLNMLNSPNISRVEGVVSNFQRRQRERKETIESFTVDTVEFAYGDALLGKFNAFSQTYNQVIFDGQKVRITYRAGSPYGQNFNSIMRLEIGK